MQIHALPAPIDTVLISGTCSVCTDTTVCSLLTSAHDMVAFIADDETTEYIIMLFPALDIDFEKPLDIKEEITVDDSRTIVFVRPEFTDIFGIREHILETGSRPDESEFAFHIPERHAETSGFPIVLEDGNDGRNIVIRNKVLIHNRIAKRC